MVAETRSEILFFNTSNGLVMDETKKA
jgi:hypothetical protein